VEAANSAGGAVLIID